MALNKQANPDQDFEQGFFQLAYDKLQSKLFNLLPFLVGFEVVKKADDGAKAVGVFGFKSENGQILYVPAFFVNGKVKDLDTLYSRNNNQFYPLNEDFAELFLKDDVTGIGSPSQERKQDLRRDSPPKSYRSIVQPPINSRIAYAEAAPEYVKGTFKAAGIEVPDYNFFATPMIKEVKASVLDYVAEDNTLKTAFWQLMEKDADFTESVRRFYTDEEIATALIPKVAEIVEPSVKVVDLDTIDKTASEVSKLEVFDKGYAIIDKRAAEEKSNVGMFKYVEKFSNPIESGFYTYITEIGHLRYGLILVRPSLLKQHFQSEDAIVIDLDSKKKGQAYIVPTNQVFVKDQVKIKDYSSVHKMMEDPAESLPSFNNTYVLINEALKCTQPFRIVENMKDANAIRRITVEPEWGCHTCIPCEKGKNDEKLPREVVLVFTKKGGDHLEYKTNMIYVPKGFKLLQIDTSLYFSGVDYSKPEAEREKQRAASRAEESLARQGKPGGLHSLLNSLQANGTFPLTVHSNGSEYFTNVAGIKKHYASALKAKIGMVIDLGLNETTGDKLIDSLVPGFTKRGYLKIAYTGDQTLDLVDEVPYTNEEGHPTYQGTPWIQQAQNEEHYDGNPFERGLGVKPEVEGLQASVNNANQLAGAGQKEIFDTQSIATLARYTDPTNKVVSYIPNFVSSLDKLGRILFMIYWDTDKFQEMYGKDEMPELIEIIKSVFKNLGDLIIFLKRKIPDLSINNNEQGMESI